MTYRVASPESVLIHLKYIMAVCALVFHQSSVLPCGCLGLIRISSGCGKNSIVALTLLHSERPKLYTILAFLSAIGLRTPVA